MQGPLVLRLWLYIEDSVKAILEGHFGGSANTPFGTNALNQSLFFIWRRYNLPYWHQIPYICRGICLYLRNGNEASEKPYKLPLEESTELHSRKTEQCFICLSSWWSKIFSGANGTTANTLQLQTRVKALEKSDSLFDISQMQTMENLALPLSSGCPNPGKDICLFPLSSLLLPNCGLLCQLKDIQNSPANIMVMPAAQERVGATKCFIRLLLTERNIN